MTHDKTVSMNICLAFSEAMSVSSGGSAQPVIEYNVIVSLRSTILGVLVSFWTISSPEMTTLMLFVQSLPGKLVPSGDLFANSLHLEDDRTLFL